MKSVFNQKSVGLAVALLCATTSSSALTLGLTRSVAILGQPLELMIPIQTDSAEGSSDLCVEADVFYGDVRQDSGRVSVSVEVPAADPSVNVRVFSQNAVDEPVVTVYLRAGCEYKSTRQYVLLADLATELNPLQGANQLKVAPEEVRSSEPRLLASVAQIAPAKIETAVASNLSTNESKRTSKFTVPSALSGNRELNKNPSGEVSRKARLKLAPLDLTIKNDSSLKITDELYSAPVEDLQKRAEAEAFWRTLNVSLEDAVRLESIGVNLKDLRTLTDKNQKSLVDLEVRLTEAKAAQFWNPLVYGLAFLLLVFGGAVVYLWTQLRGSVHKSDPWWLGNGVAGSKAKELESENIPSPKDKGAGLDVKPNSKLVSKSSSIDIDLELGEPTHQKSVEINEKVKDILLATPVKSMVGHSDFVHSVNATLREIKTQEMIDATQQAEFFMTLGQHEEAIEVLVSSTRNTTEDNPHVYLELLKVLHTLSRRAEYDHYREEFNALFSGHIPVYGHFHEGGDGLDVYVDVCKHISELWPNSGALEFIDHCLVRAKNESAVTFDLEAFRDLLTLHGTALKIVASSNSDLPLFSAVKEKALKPSFDFATSQRVSDVRKASIPLKASLTDARSIDIDFDLEL
jgi:pilus assembly protein FimV